MILILAVRLAATTHVYLDAYAPTNILIRALLDSRRQPLAFPVSAVLAVGLVGAWLTSIIDSGGPGRLNPLALLCAWNMIKFGWVSFAVAWSRAVSVFRVTSPASTGPFHRGKAR